MICRYVDGIFAGDGKKKEEQKFDLCLYKFSGL